VHLGLHSRLCTYSQPTSRRIHAPDGEGAHLQVSQVFSHAPLGPAKGEKVKKRRDRPRQTGAGQVAARALIVREPRHRRVISGPSARRPHSHPSHEALPRAARHRVSRAACLVVSHALLGASLRAGHRAPVPDGRLITTHVWPAQRRQGARQAAGCWPGLGAAQPRTRRAAWRPARLGSSRRCSTQAWGLAPWHGRRRRAGRRAEGVCAARACVGFGLRKRGAPALLGSSAAHAGDVWVASQHAGPAVWCRVVWWVGLCLLTFSRPLPGERPAAPVRGLPLPGGPGAPSGRAD
jgi:hypothetical protein